MSGEFSPRNFLKSSSQPFLTESCNLHLTLLFKEISQEYCIILWKWVYKLTRTQFQKGWPEKEVKGKIWAKFLMKVEIYLFYIKFWIWKSAIGAIFVGKRYSQDGGRSSCRSPRWGAGEFVWRGFSLLGALMASILQSYRELGTQCKHWIFSHVVIY